MIPPVLMIKNIIWRHFKLVGPLVLTGRSELRDERLSREALKIRNGKGKGHPRTGHEDPEGE